MIKKLILALLLLIPSMAFAQKFGTVDAETIMTNMPEIKEMQTTLDAVSKKYEAEFQALQEKFQKDLEAYQTIAQDAETPDAIKQRRAQELQEQEQKIYQFRESASQDIQQQQQRLMAPVQERVRQAIQAVGTEGGFTFIFEKTVPLYVGTDAVDVTPLVKSKLNIQ